MASEKHSYYKSLESDLEKSLRNSLFNNGYTGSFTYKVKAYNQAKSGDYPSIDGVVYFEENILRFHRRFETGTYGVGLFPGNASLHCLTKPVNGDKLGGSWNYEPIILDPLKFKEELEYQKHTLRYKLRKLIY